MKTLLHFTLLCWSLCASLPLLAQSQTFESGHLRWKMSPNGDLFDLDGWLSIKSGNSWIPVVNSPSLWIAGMNPNGMIALQKTGEGGDPRLAGSDYMLNKIWSVTANEIQQHQADLADNGQIDDPIPAIFQWPGRGSVFFNAYNNMSLPDEDLARSMAGFYDLKGTGLYNPSDGDYPILPLRNCNEQPIVPDQMHYCVFTRPEGPYLGVSLPVEVHLYIFTYGCLDAHPLNQTVFVYQQFVYTTEEGTPTGNPVFEDCYVGNFLHPMIGCNVDDYIGSFPELKAVFAYNSQQTDCDGVHFDVFNGQPPAVGVQVLRGPLDEMGQPVQLKSTTYYSNTSIPGLGSGEPQTIEEYYLNLQGKWKDGTPLTNGGNGYGGTEPVSFAFPGLPEQPGGWTEWEAQNQPGSRFTLLNYGPFNLQPGAVNEVLTAYSFYRGPGSHLDQASGLYDQMALIQSFADACFIPENTPGFPGCEPLPVTAPQVERLAQELRVFPNPFEDWLNVDLPELAATYQVSLYDVQGRQLWQATLSAGPQRLHLPNLPEGLYLLRAQSGQSAPLVAKVIR